MKEPAEIAPPSKLVKAEEVIAEYVQRYGFTASARAYFGPATEGVCNDNMIKTSFTEAVQSNAVERVDTPFNKGTKCLATAEKEELHRLRCELKEMREERDLLA
ncbi:MAG: hypothetical protein RLQ73_21720 [Hoeflea sp. D1-CHI-28]